MDYNNYNYTYQAPVYEEKQPGVGLAVTSLILGIVSLVCCCGGTCGVILPMGSILSILSMIILFVCDIVGIILGIVGLAKKQNKAMCIIGIILCALGIILGIVTIILATLGVAALFAASLSDYYNGGGYYY